MGAAALWSTAPLRPAALRSATWLAPAPGMDAAGLRPAFRLAAGPATASGLATRTGLAAAGARGGL